MKNILLSLLLVGGSSYLHAQINENYYVVIGGFSKLENATRYRANAETNPKLISAVKDQFSVAYAFNSARKINYVYVLKTSDKKKAFALSIKLKAETEFKDCWVFNGNLDTAEGQSGDAPLVPVVKEPAVVVVDEKKETVAQAPEKLKITIDSIAPQPKEEVIPEKKAPALAGKPFVFKLADKNGKEVLGAAHIYESSKASIYQSFKANEIAYVPPPVNKANTYVVKIQAAGYKKAEKVIQFGKFDSLKVDQKETLVDFELVKVKSGDYIDFNEVHFMTNSALMTPNSQNELDGLATLMKENKRYKIKIHGFCNGSGKRPIISRGTSEKFFELEPDKNKAHTASAKELSSERAELVKAYLVSQGVEAKRVAVKAEGGDIPLYPEKGAMASHNDRVEIEVKSN